MVFDTRPDRTGWTVFDTRTDRPALLGDLALVGLDLSEAEELVALLNQRERDLDRAAGRDRHAPIRASIRRGPAL